MKKLMSVVLLAIVSLSVSAGMQSTLSLQHIQARWAQINYQQEEGDARTDAFETLIKDAASLVASQPTAEHYIWLGIVQSTTAGAEGGLGALSYAKAARKSLEKALAIDENALQGSALTSLGVLYHKVPGWPIAFGSDKKAKQLLTQALKINPDGIDPNYFYAEFLYDEGEYQKAMEYLNKALAASPRPDRALADEGRRGEIQALIAKVDNKLH
ncbi:tetratricopeptide repeat protein [Alteromonas sp. H39]|uniref:tetratricopeptide repeat protein n=1 Tax=Alteromonas sp. H39 TaxID=3389876 RepID=UPI0039E056F9